mgnify:CR=1 FL=1
MAQIFGFDEIEKIRSMPYNRFFGEMGITKKQKQERVEFSNKIDGSEYVYARYRLILIMKETGRVDARKAAEQFETKLLKWIARYIDLDSETKAYISDFCLSTAQVTADHVNEKYYVSEDRIRLVSENTALDFLNYKDFKEATRSKTYKTWNTIIDGKERETHHKEDHNYFFVGKALMRYPHDMAVPFTNPEEVINCRCWVTYS